MGDAIIGSTHYCAITVEYQNKTPYFLGKVNIIDFIWKLIRSYV